MSAANLFSGGIIFLLGRGLGDHHQGRAEQALIEVVALLHLLHYGVRCMLITLNLTHRLVAVWVERLPDRFDRGDTELLEYLVMMESDEIWDIIDAALDGQR